MKASNARINTVTIGAIILFVGLVNLLSGVLPHSLNSLFTIFLGVSIGGWTFISPKTTKEKLIKITSVIVTLALSLWLLIFLNSKYSILVDLEVPNEVSETPLVLNFTTTNAVNSSINSQKQTVQNNKINASVSLESGENEINVVLTNEIGETLTKSFNVFYLSPEIKTERQAEVEQKEIEKLARAERERQRELDKVIKRKEELAGVCSRNYIEALVAPRPADFPIKDATFDKEGDYFRIFSHVDTVNGFNAPIRQAYYCEISGVDLDAFTCQQYDCKWQ